MVIVLNKLRYLTQTSATPGFLTEPKLCSDLVLMQSIPIAMLPQEYRHLLNTACKLDFREGQKRTIDEKINHNLVYP